MDIKKNSSPSSLLEGRVVKNTGSAYVVKTSDGLEFPCRIKGNFRIKGIRTTNPVAVGDVVKFAHASDDAFYIREIVPRKNYIIRRASNLSKESHILAANIDQAILVASIFNPETPLTFIDRFLATAEAYSIPAILVFNKSDLWTPEIWDYANQLKEIYENIGYPVIFTSASKEEGIENLKEITRQKISLLAGNSGVGKSSLINAMIPGCNLRTGEVSDIHHTGTHTTTFSEMIPLPEGGDLIDIPGVKGFGMIEFQPAEVSHYFPEIFKKSCECRYGDCRHLGEPGCAVAEAVENGEIYPTRFSSYLSIMEEVAGDKGEDKYRKPF
ncbi:MAG: ribosome small subunit-dependent GTPase A [Muribaculaceae bacterium]|nr:ribosome small subunit-dependent GTPase A [Muribaculaceae bacterium]